MSARASVLEAAIDRALCRHPDVQAEWWYALVGSADDQRARQLCGACSLRQPCAKAALDRADRWGVWGGLDPEQRAAFLAIPAEQRPPLAAYLRHADRTQIRGRGPRPCGTPAAHARHIRRGEKPCEPCRAAHNTDVAAAARRSRDRKKASA